MIPAERRQKMLLIINQQGTATITQLSDQFAVSEMTIHRDLKFLESSGRVQKTYGGVVANQAIIETEYERRRRTNIEAKQMIGKEAAKLIDNGDTIIVDGSTSCLAMLPELANKNNLTVFVTGVNACLTLSAFPNIELHCTGGMVQEGTDWFVGATTIEVLKSIHADKCFISAACIYPQFGIMDPIQTISEVKKQIVSAANEVIVLADHSKFGRVTKFQVLSFNEIDLIITDAEKDSPCVKEIIEQGVEILFVEKT